MNYNNIATLHVDGSLTEYISDCGNKMKTAGLGAYIVINGKIKDKFFKKLENVPFIDHHEEHAIIEALKWTKQKNVECVKVKTDSLYAVNLFSGNKKAVSKEDKFFLVQYIMLEYLFETIEIEYVSRDEDDLSHNLSRTYLKEIDSNQKLFNKKDYMQSQEINEFEIKKFIYNQMTELNRLN